MGDVGFGGRVRGLRDSQSYVPCSRISPTAGSVITDGGGGRWSLRLSKNIRYSA